MIGPAATEAGMRNAIYQRNARLRATFPRHVIDRATEWVNLNVDLGDDNEAAWDDRYDAAILSACQEITAVDAAADHADRTANT